MNIKRDYSKARAERIAKQNKVQNNTTMTSFGVTGEYFVETGNYPSNGSRTGFKTLKEARKAALPFLFKFNSVKVLNSKGTLLTC